MSQLAQPSRRDMALDIKRINELAAKQKSVGLNAQEKEEQELLRRAYIDSVLGNLKSNLDNTKVVDKNGKEVDIKPKKGN